MFCYIKYSEAMLNLMRLAPTHTLAHGNNKNQGVRKLQSISQLDDTDAEEESMTAKVIKEAVFALMLERHQIDMEYVKSPNNNTQSITAKRSVRLSAPLRKRKFHSVAHDGNAKLMINPDCFVQMFMDYMYTALDVSRQVKLDICDEAGNLMNLRSLAQDENLKQWLECGQTYNLVARQTLKEGNPPTVFLLINITNDGENDLLGTIPNCVHDNPAVMDPRKEKYISSVRVKVAN